MGIVLFRRLPESLKESVVKWYAVLPKTFKNIALNSLFAKRVPVVRQMELSDCGIACLCSIMQFHALCLTLSELKIRFATSLQGLTMFQIVKMARELGASARGIAFSPAQVHDIALPAILHWNESHYVVLERVTRSFVEIMDPAVGRSTFTHAEFAINATGYAIEISVDRIYEYQVPTRPLRFSDFIARNRNTWAYLRSSLLLTLIIESAVIASPFLVQLIVDEAVTKNDREILPLLILIFGGIAIWDMIARFLRGYLHVGLSAHLHNDAKIGLVSRMMRLPLFWFEHRGVNQIYQRLRQVDLLQTALSETTFSALLDGGFSLISLAIMFTISPLLSIFSVVALALYIASREVMLYSIRRKMAASLSAVAKADGELLRIVDDVRAIKLSTSEATALGRWTNMQLDASRERIGIQLAEYQFALFNGCLRHAERLGVMYLGAIFALKGEMSIGMVFAYLMFRDHFLDKSIGCAHSIYELRQAGGMVDELRDVTEAPVEMEQRGFSTGTAPVDAGGELRFDNVNFTYGAFAEPVLHDVSVVIQAGDKVAITGMSGSGKSTFLKILASLYVPTSGVFQIDGVDVRRIALGHYRRQIVVVDSKPSFLTGSILENIFFECEEHNPSWAIECARDAGLHDDILRQPSGYATLVTFQGDSLSSGQKQRLMIARALYARPRLLVLDEPTAHLDAPTERAIVERLLTLNATVVVVTHNPAILSWFSTVLRVERGSVIRYGTEGSEGRAGDGNSEGVGHVV